MAETRFSSRLGLPHVIVARLSRALWVLGLLVSAGCPAPAPPPSRRPPLPRAEEARPRPAAPPVELGAARRYALRPEDPGAPKAVALSPDGARIALATRFGGLHLWELASARRTVLRPFGDELDEPVFLAFTPDGRTLVAAGFDDRVLSSWDATSGRLLKETPLGGEVQGLAVAPRLAVLGLPRGAELRRLPDGALLRAIPMPYQLAVPRVAIDAGGALVALASAAGHLQVFDVSRGYALASLPGQGSPPAALAFDEGGEGLLLGQKDGTVRRLVAATLQPDRGFYGPAPGEPVQGLSLTAAGLYALRAGGELLLLNSRTGALRTRRSHGRPLESLSASASGLLLAAVEPERAAFLLQLPAAPLPFSAAPLPFSAAPLPFPADPPAPTLPPAATLAVSKHSFHTLPAAGSDIVSFAVTRSGDGLAVGLHPPAVTAWSWIKGPKAGYRRSWLRTLPPPAAGTASRPLRVALVPSELGPAVVLHGPTDQLRRFRVLGGFPMATLPTRAQGLKSLLPSPDGKLLVTTTTGVQVLLWSAAGLPKGRFTGLENPYWVALSADGALLAQVAGVDDLGVYQLPAGTRLWSQSHRPHRLREVLALRFDPSGQELHTIHRTGFVRVHSARAGALLSRRHLPLPRGITACDLRPDLRLLACGARGRVHLLELPAGVSLGVLALPAESGSGPIRQLSFLEDGSGLLLQRGARNLTLLRLQ